MSLDCHKKKGDSRMLAWGRGKAQVCTEFHVPKWQKKVNKHVLVKPVVEYADSIIMELTNEVHTLKKECKAWRKVAEGAGLSLPEEKEEDGKKEEEDKEKKEETEEDGKGSGNAFTIDDEDDDEVGEGGGRGSADGGKGKSGGKPAGWLKRSLLTKLVVPKTERLLSYGILSCAIVHCGMP